MTARVATYVPVLSPLHDRHALRELEQACLERLAPLGLQAAGVADAVPDDVLIFLVLSGGTEREMERLRLQWDPAGTRPVWLLAIPLHNSLAAALEFLAARRDRGQPGRVFYLPLDGGAPADLAEALRVVQAWRGMRHARLGLVGAPSDWLLTSGQDDALIRAAWGPAMVHIPIDECLRLYDGAAGQPAAAAAAAWRDLATACREPTADDLAKSRRMLDALAALVQQHRLDALTIRCFDLLGARDVTACLALAQLNTDGLPAGCEGDLPSALGMLWARLLLGASAWMANPSRLDPDKSLLTVAHCTIPLDMVSGHGLRSHFESGRCAAVAGQLAADEVTVFRLGGSRLDEYWVTQGRVVERGRDEQLCRTQATLQLDEPGAIPRILARPLGNHLLVVAGRHAAFLRRAFELLGELRG